MSHPLKPRRVTVTLCAIALVACTAPKPTEVTVDAFAPVPALSQQPASAPTTATRAAPSIVEAAADSDALSLIRTKRLEAKADGRVLVVYVGAAWCEPCRKFKLELSSGRLDRRLANVMFLAFDVDKDDARLAAAGYTFKFVPFIALPGADGHPGDTQQATGKGGDAWRELLAKLEAWQSP